MRNKINYGKRHLCRVFREKGMKLRQIKDLLGFSFKTISKWANRADVVDSKRSGRPSKLSETDRKVIIRRAKDVWTDRGGSLRSIAKHMEVRGNKVSHTTIANFINKFPWGKPRKRPIKPLLTNRNIHDRLTFGLRLMNEGFTDSDSGRKKSRNILFTDEKIFMLHHSPNPQNHRIRTENPAAIQVYKKPKFSQFLYVAGGMTYSGLTELILVKARMTGEYYKKTLLPVYLKSLKRTVVKRNISKTILVEDFRLSTLMQDGHSSHWAKKNEGELAKFPNVLRGWPGNSPDLNPLENLWAIVQSEVDKKEPQTLEDLKKAVFSAWNSVRKSDLEVLSNSFPKRILQVVLNRGQHSKY
jgi:transposase